jgi:hypothetical protein
MDFDQSKLKRGITVDILLNAKWGLKVNTERTQYMIMSPHQQNADMIKIHSWQKKSFCSNVWKQQQTKIAVIKKQTASETDNISTFTNLYVA